MNATPVFPGQSAPAAPVADAAGPLRVLVIEDNRDAAESTVLLLQLLGHAAEAAFDGRAGVTAARQAVPHVVLCDVGLPGGMNGYDVAKTLRAELPTSLLVAVTGYGRDEDVRRAGVAGFHRHLTKPVSLEQLREILNGGGHATA